MERLRVHLQPWVDAGQSKVAEDAYAKLAGALPEGQQRLAQLAVVHLWVTQVMKDHQRLAAAGLKVPEKLDETFAKALRRLYELQDGLTDADPFLVAGARRGRGDRQPLQQLGITRRPSRPCR